MGELTILKFKSSNTALTTNNFIKWFLISIFGHLLKETIQKKTMIQKSKGP